jgi:hypothetical protein
MDGVGRFFQQHFVFRKRQLLDGNVQFEDAMEL